MQIVQIRCSYHHLDLKFELEVGLNLANINFGACITLNIQYRLTGNDNFTAHGALSTLLRVVLQL